MSAELRASRVAPPFDSRPVRNARKMDATIERECSALGGLFQQIVTDMKVRNVRFYLGSTDRTRRPRAPRILHIERLSGQCLS